MKNRRKANGFHISSICHPFLTETMCTYSNLMDLYQQVILSELKNNKKGKTLEGKASGGERENNEFSTDAQPGIKHAIKFYKNRIISSTRESEQIISIIRRRRRREIVHSFGSIPNISIVFTSLYCSQLESLGMFRYN